MCVHKRLIQRERRHTPDVMLSINDVIIGSLLTYQFLDVQNMLGDGVTFIAVLYHMTQN